MSLPVYLQAVCIAIDFAIEDLGLRCRLQLLLGDADHLYPAHLKHATTPRLGHCPDIADWLATRPRGLGGAEPGQWRW